MTKHERKLYLEYCREIEERNIKEYERVRDQRNAALDRYEAYEKKYRRAPWWRRWTMAEPHFIPLPNVEPFILESSLEGFYRRLAEEEQVAR